MRLMEEFEEELSRELTPKKVRELGDSLRAKLRRAATVIEILKKNKWKWTSGTKDIYFFKGISKEFAVKEIKNLKVDDLVEVEDL